MFLRIFQHDLIVGAVEILLAKNEALALSSILDTVDLSF